jgi:hypothetical protein
MGDAEYECAKCGDLLTPSIPKVSCGNNCNECGRYSHRANQPNYLYLLTHAQFKLHKIGIGTSGKDKGFLQQLINEGWEVHGLWHESDARRTFIWETAIFKQLEVEFSSISPATAGLIGRRDRSWVESVDAQVISVSALAHLISKVVSEK